MIKSTVGEMRRLMKGYKANALLYFDPTTSLFFVKTYSNGKPRGRIPGISKIIDDNVVRDLLREGLSRSAIAKQLKRDISTIRRSVHRLRLSQNL